MSPILRVAMLVCGLTISAIGIFSAVNHAFASCFALIPVLWGSLPECLKRRIRG